MMTQKESSKSEAKGLAEAKKARAARANKIYCEACQEMGIKISSWEDFTAWQEYVDGKINEGTLAEKAEMELEKFSSTFGRYLVIEKEDPTPPEETKKKERVKQANTIYKNVCSDGGLTVCFFNSFAAWSDYVEGKISDSEFEEKAKVELDKMREENP